MLFDKGKVVVDASKKVTITRLQEDERSLSDKMTMMDVAKLFRGEMDPSEVYTVEEKDHESAWGQQHIAVLTNFAAHVNDGTPLIADGAEGINGVRLASGLSVGVDRSRDRPGRLPGRGVPRRAQQAHRGRGHVPRPFLIAQRAREASTSTPPRACTECTRPTTDDVRRPDSNTEPNQ